MFVFTNCIQSS